MAQITSVYSNCQHNMGLGSLGSPGVIFKRKFRWGMTVRPSCGIPIDEVLVKAASRPKLSINDKKIDMRHGVMYLPGKAEWQTTDVEFFDVVGDAQANMPGLSGLWNWILSVYDFANGYVNGLCMGSARKDYSGEVTLSMYSGCGQTLEQWQLLDAWPKDIDWGDLGFDSEDECTVKLTLRFADVRYSSDCMQNVKTCTCTTCSG